MKVDKVSRRLERRRGSIHLHGKEVWWVGGESNEGGCGELNRRPVVRLPCAGYVLHVGSPYSYCSLFTTQYGKCTCESVETAENCNISFHLDP